MATLSQAIGDIVPVAAAGDVVLVGDADSAAAQTLEQPVPSDESAPLHEEGVVVSKRVG